MLLCCLHRAQLKKCVLALVDQEEVNELDEELEDGVPGLADEVALDVGQHFLHRDRYKLLSGGVCP